MSTPRGLALKLFDVEGERLSGSEQARTQDFVMVNSPTFDAPNLQVFLHSLRLVASTTDKAQGLKKALSALLQKIEGGLESMGYQSTALKALGGQQPTSVLGDTFFSQLPVLYGPYMAKVRVTPSSDALKAKTGQLLDLTDRPNGLRDDAIAFFSQQGGEWNLQVQLCTDPQKMPIEQASVAWDEQVSPYLTVATIRAAPQSVWDEARIQRVDDEMAFSPWHGITAHRPLGAIMRARKPIYELSAQFRSRHTAQPVREPRCPFHL